MRFFISLFIGISLLFSVGQIFAIQAAKPKCEDLTGGGCNNRTFPPIGDAYCRELTKDPKSTCSVDCGSDMLSDKACSTATTPPTEQQGTCQADSVGNVVQPHSCKFGYEPKVTSTRGEGTTTFICSCVAEKPKCDDGTEGVQTQLGCIPTSAGGFAQWFLNLGIGIGILLALLFIILGGYDVLTSAGNPDQLDEGKQKITAAVAGLLFILLSVLILTTIGVEVLGIDKSKFGF